MEWREEEGSEKGRDEGGGGREEGKKEEGKKGGRGGWKGGRMDGREEGERKLVYIFFYILLNLKRKVKFTCGLDYSVSIVIDYLSSNINNSKLLIIHIIFVIYDYFFFY